MKHKHLLVGLACLAIVLMAAVLAWWAGSSALLPSGSADKVATAASTPPNELQQDSSSPARPAEPRRVELVAKNTRGTRSVDLERIKARLGARDRSGARSGTFVVSKEKTEVDEQTMAFFTEAMKEIQPLLRECYASTLKTEPGLFGYARANISLAADDEYGALVESSEVVGDEKIAGSATLTECLRETLYELRFPPRTVSGRMQVSMPIIFATNDGDKILVPDVPDEAKQKTFSLQEWLVDKALNE
jgi:hypothetical protein